MEIIQKFIERRGHNLFSGYCTAKDEEGNIEKYHLIEGHRKGKKNYYLARTWKGSIVSASDYDEVATLIESLAAERSTPKLSVESIWKGRDKEYYEFISNRLNQKYAKQKEEFLKSKRMKVIIAGTRTFDDYKLLKENCDVLLQDYLFKDLEIVSGTATGVDVLGERYAEENHLPISRFPADWKNLNTPNAIIKENRYGKYNAAAGYDRNKKMAEYADMLIAFWDGESSGTRNMIRLAKLKGLKIEIINYEKRRSKRDT